MAKCPPPKKKEHRWRIVRLRTCLPFGKAAAVAFILLAAAIISAFETTGSHPVPSKLSHELFITENTMWRGLVGLLFVAAAIGCFFVSARYAGDATTMYILIDLGCAALVGAAATQIPGVAAFFYSYIAVLVVTLGLTASSCSLYRW